MVCYFVLWRVSVVLLAFSSGRIAQKSNNDNNNNNTNNNNNVAAAGSATSMDNCCVAAASSSSSLYSLSSSSSSSSSSLSSTPRKSPITLSVCLSPGCLADGAIEALNLLRALAPEHVHVQEGACRSFCGSGPIVVQDIISVEQSNNNNRSNQRIKTKPHKKMLQQDRIFKLLYPNDDDGDGSSVDMIPIAAIIQGYNFGIQGDVAYKAGNYEQAVAFYEQAVELAFRPAMELQSRRDEYELQQQQTHKKATGATSVSLSSSSSSLLSKPGSQPALSPPSALEWLVRVRRYEALAKLALKDLDGAVVAIQASCTMSRDTSRESWMVLARICETRGDTAGELLALENLLEKFVEPVPNHGSRTDPNHNKPLTFQEKNDLRLAEIRLQKLRFMQSRNMIPSK